VSLWTFLADVLPNLEFPKPAHNPWAYDHSH